MQEETNNNTRAEEVVTSTSDVPSTTVNETAVSEEVIDITPSVDVQHIEPVVIAEEVATDVVADVAPETIEVV